MATGTVKWFTDVTGYGFITQDDDDDLFVQFSAIPGSDFRSLTEGQELQFDVVEGPKSK